MVERRKSTARKRCWRRYLVTMEADDRLLTQNRNEPAIPGTSMTKTGRNQEILAAHLAGESDEIIAARHQLKVCSVQEITRIEKLKIEVSPVQYYKGLR